MSKNAACCGCGWTGRVEHALDHTSYCVPYAERWRDDPGDDYLKPDIEWARLQRDEAELAARRLETQEAISRRAGARQEKAELREKAEREKDAIAAAGAPEAIPDARVVVLDSRGEAQRESDDIRAGFDVYRRIGTFIRKERYRDLGYDSALAWWNGEHICDYSQIAEADRKDLVLALTGAGLSVRSAGAMLAISPAQVQRDKTGKSSNKATTREGRKAAKVSPHTPETAGQAGNGGGTPSPVPGPVEDPFAFLGDEPGEPVSAGSTQIDSKTAQDHECVCQACGNRHRKEEN